MGKKIVLCDFDLYDQVTKAANVSSITLPKEMKLGAYLDVDDALYEKINDDDTLAAEIFDDVSKIFKATVPKLAQECKTLNGQCRKTSKRDKQGIAKITQALERRVKTVLEEAGREMSECGKAQIEKLNKKQGDKNRYTIKTGVNLTMGSIGITVGLIGLSAAPFTMGMSLALSIWGFWKGAKGMWDQINSLRVDIDNARDTLNLKLQELVNAYKDRSANMTGASETAQSVVQWLLGTSGTTISKCDDDLKAYRSKIADLDRKVRQAGKDLHKTIDEQSDLQKKIDSLEDECKKQGVESEELTEAKRKLDDLARSTKETIEDLVNLNKQLKRNDEAADGYAKVLEALQAGKPAWAVVAEKLIKYGPDLAISGGSNVLGAEQDLVNFGHDVVQALTDFGADQGLG